MFENIYKCSRIVSEAVFSKKIIGMRLQKKSLSNAERD
jgi:hypothetical protein